MREKWRRIGFLNQGDVKTTKVTTTYKVRDTREGADTYYPYNTFGTEVVLIGKSSGKSGKRAAEIFCDNQISDDDFSGLSRSLRIGAAHRGESPMAFGDGKKVSPVPQHRQSLKELRAEIGDQDTYQPEKVRKQRRNLRRRQQNPTHRLPKSRVEKDSFYRPVDPNRWPWGEFVAEHPGEKIVYPKRIRSNND